MARKRDGCQSLAPGAAGQISRTTFPTMGCFSSTYCSSPVFRSTPLLVVMGAKDWPIRLRLWCDPAHRHSHCDPGERELFGLPVDGKIEKNVFVYRVVVVKIMRTELIKPDSFSGIGVARENSAGKFVIARPRIGVPRPRIRWCRNK